MAPSSLKKMSGLPRIEEGNYASSEKTLWDASVNGDLGLTLLPGSQIQRKDEKGLRAAAESSPKNPASHYVDKPDQLRPLEVEIRAQYSNQETAYPNEAKNLSSSTIPDSGLARFSHVTDDRYRERPFSQGLVVKNDGSAVQGNSDAADGSPYNEQQMSTDEIKNAKSCQHENYSSRVVKWRKLGSRPFNEFRDSKVSQGKEVAFEPHYNTFQVDCDQNLSENNAIYPRKRKRSDAVIGFPLNESGGGSESSKAELYGQTRRSIAVAPTHHHHQSTTSSRRSTPSIISFASASPAKHQKCKPRKESQLPNLPKLPPEIRTKIRRKRKRKGVNDRSWTNHFPAKLRHANLPAPSSFLPAPSFLFSFPNNQNQNHQHSLTSINFHTYNNFSNTTLSTTFPHYPTLLKDSHYPLDFYPLERFLNTGNQHQSARRRSASMPNLWSTRTPTNMNSSDNFGPAPMLTPPREKPNFSLYPQGNSAESLTADTSRDSPIAAGGWQYHGQPLQVKPNYSLEEVKGLMFNCFQQTRSLKAENMSLQSSNIAMKKGMESLQSEKADMIKQTQHYERTVTQKDQQIQAMRQKGMSLQQQYRQVWDEHHRLVASLRKDNGTSNPSAIAQRIKQGHAPNPSGTASQGNQPSANASPVYCTNSAQLSMSKPELEQIPTGLQCHVQPLSVHGSSEIDMTDASSRSFRQQPYTANHNPANLLQTAPTSAYPEANLANASSRVPVQPRFAAGSQNHVRSPHNQSFRRIQSHQPFVAPVGAVTTDIHNENHPLGQVSTRRVTIDLTDESQPPSSAASRDTSVHQTPQSSVQSEHLPFNARPGQSSTAKYGVPDSVPSQYPSDPSAQNQTLQGQLPPSQNSQSADREVMQLQREAYAHIAGKSYTWLRGQHPLRMGTYTEQQTGLPNARRYSQGNAEEPVIFTGSSEVGSVAPVPEAASDRQSKHEARKKAKVVVTAEAKKERARVYRKTAADRKKKREKEDAEQTLQGENPSTNAMRAQKQDRRANRVGKRQEQAWKPSGGVRPGEPQKTLDGQLYREDTDVQQAAHQGSMEQAPSDDHDSLFGDDEDNQMETENSEASPEADSAMHEDGAVVEDGVDAAFVAELEAQLAAEVDDTTWNDFDQNDTPGGDDGCLDGPCESEESEEE